jgi:hypothetical protein
MNACPHCRSEFDDRLSVCPSCAHELPARCNPSGSAMPKADVSTGAAGLRTSRQPQAKNALTAIWVFNGLGPYLGAVAVIGHSDASVLAPLVALHPFVLIFAYTFGLVPALVAAVLYALSSAILSVWMRLFVVRTIAGALLGTLCGIATLYLFRDFFRFDPAGEFSKALRVGAFAGLGSGGLAGYYFPVGVARTPDARKGDA